MRSSAYWTFSDPEPFERSIRAGFISGYWVKRGGYSVNLARINLGKVWLQRVQENNSRLARIGVDGSRSAVLFRTLNVPSALRHRGCEVDGTSLVSLGAGTEDLQASDGPTDIGTMSLAPHDLALYGPLLAERDLVAPSATSFLRPDGAALARMRYLHDVALWLAKIHPDRIRNPAVNRALEASFISAMIDCLAGARPARSSRAAERRAAIMGRMDEHLAARRTIPVYVTEICEALAVTERTLERACQETLGMGPKRYLWLRRLHMARRALSDADPSRTTVAQIALAHGFWELGRFAVRYHQYFGEPPSATLH